MEILFVKKLFSMVFYLQKLLLNIILTLNFSKFFSPFFAIVFLDIEISTSADIFNIKKFFADFVKKTHKNVDFYSHHCYYLIKQILSKIAMILRRFLINEIYRNSKKS